MHNLASTFFVIDNSRKVKKVKLLCWILADPDLLYTKVIHLKETWGRRCEKLLVMSSKEDKDFPAIGLPNTQAGRSHIAFKAKAAWKYIYKHYRGDYDFFIKTDTDTYLVVENLLHFLSDRDPSKPHFYGHIYTPTKWKFPYIAGGPGLVLTREFLRLLITEGHRKHEKDCWSKLGMVKVLLHNIRSLFKWIHLSSGLGIFQSAERDINPFFVQNRTKIKKFGHKWEGEGAGAGYDVCL